MHIIENCPMMHENGLLNLDGATTNSNNGIGHSNDDQRDNVHYDPEDSNSPPLCSQENHLESLETTLKIKMTHKLVQRATMSMKKIR